MKAVAARVPAGSLGAAGCRPRVAVSSLLAAVVLGALADELPPLAAFDPPAATGAGAARSRLELSSSTVPLFENLDGATRSSRIDLTWMPRRAPSLGLALGLTSFDGPGLRSPGGVPPAVDLGIHWRPALDSQYRLDVTAWRRMQPADAISLVQNREPSYGARLEMQIGSAPSAGLVAARGFLGLQLESGARITVRRSGGRPMVYYRTKF